MINPEEDGTHYLAHHNSGNIIEVWYSSEPEVVGWVGRITDAIVPLNPRDFTVVDEVKKENAMSKVQTEAEVEAARIYTRRVAEVISGGNKLDDTVADNGYTVEDALMHEFPWAKQFQPQPDASDDKCANDIWKIFENEKKMVKVGGVWCGQFMKKAEALIARHTEAKVAEARVEEWNRGAEATRERDATVFEEAAAQLEHSDERENFWEIQKARGDAAMLRALPILPYQKKGE